MTPGTDVLMCQFTLEELRVVVQEAHRVGLAVTAHAHGLPAVQQCADAEVDGIEHCSCLTPSGFRVPPELAERLAAAGTFVCPTLGREIGSEPPPQVKAMMEAALSSATSVAAKACGLTDRTGRLRAGLDADLLIVDGNPLQDITVLRAVRTVVSRGREVDLTR